MYTGIVNAMGSGVNITGLFDALTLGTAGSCKGASPQLANLKMVYSFGPITAACGVVVDTAEAFNFNSLAGSFVSVRNGGRLTAQSAMTMAGDSLVIGDTTQVGSFGTASIGGLLRLVGDGSTLYVDGTSEFTGTGNISAGTIALVGDATFTGSGGSGYYFSAGIMEVYGNFVQKGTGSAYNASPNYPTWFIGSNPQTIQMETPASNSFGTLNLQNDSGVSLLSNLTFPGSDYTPSIQVWYAPLTVPEGVTLTLPGYLNFYSGGTMLLNGTATYWGCYGDGATSPISGSGTANGKAASDGGGCVYGGSYRAGLSLRAGQSMSATVRPTLRKPMLGRAPARPVKKPFYKPVIKRKASK